MRLVPHGPDVPDKLLTAQERGDVVFICGAGVSMRLGLPSFGGLVERIYQHLHEDWHNHPAESQGMEVGGSFYRQYDRVLRQLEKRLSASDTPRNRGMRERFKGAIRASLTADANPDLSAHLNLVELSRDEEGTKRLITTNFDTLFEQAWWQAKGTRLTSHAGVAMPQPRVAGFSGVMHLHGRLADEALQLPETDFVVTSAEFGDAYLRTGWASRYVYDLARTQTIVLIGYSADDAPVRYLLEALEADRTRYPDLHDVYAFGSCEPGNEALERGIWLAKGVTEPILYDAPAHNHSALYDTIAAWKDYADNPTAWRREKLRTIFSIDFADVTPQIVADALPLLRHGDASALLGELSPDPKWVPELLAKGIFGDGKASPGQWIAGRIDDADMIRASSALPRFDDATRWFVERALRESTSISSLRRQAWELLSSPRRRTGAEDRDLDWFRTLPRIQAGATDYDACELIARIASPKLHIEKVLYYDPALRDGEAELLSELLTVDYISASYPPPGDIVGSWSTDVEGETSLVRLLVRRLAEALEEAEGVGFLDTFDRASGDVPSVADHAQNAYAAGFYPIVRVVADLWSRMAEKDATAARAIAIGWRDSPYTLIRRLWLFALANAAFSPEVSALAIIDLTDEHFWNSDGQVELMRTVVGRWQEFPDDSRKAIERRIRSGPPREMFGEHAFAEDADWLSVFDSSTHERLSRIKASGGELDDESDKIIAAIVERHPKWEERKDDRSDFRVWSETGSGPSGHPELLKDVEDGKLVSEAMRLQRERYFEEGDIWRLVVNSDPDRALRALKKEAEENRWDTSAWRTLLTAATNSKEPGLQVEVAVAVRALPDEQLGEMLPHVASWLREKRGEISPHGFDGDLIAVWDRLAALTYPAAPPDRPAPGDGDRLINEALNRPGGVVAWALLEALAATNPAPNSGLPAELAPRFEMLIAATGRSGLLARVMLGWKMVWLFSVAPAWVMEHLVPRLTWDHDEAPFIWHAYARGGAVGMADMFNALRPQYIEAFERDVLQDDDLAVLSGRLVAIGVWHRYGNQPEYLLNDATIKTVLEKGPTRSRKDASYRLWQMMANPTFDELGQLRRWREIASPYFLAIWPLDAALRAEDTSRDLVHMALDGGPAFPEIVDAIRDLVVPYQLYNLAHSLRLEPAHGALVATHPRAFLRLASAVIDPLIFPVPPDLQSLLDDAAASDPNVANEPEYVRLSGLARQGNA